MQKEFRETLQKKFGDIAKNQLTVKKGSDEAKQLEIDLNQAIGEAVKTRQSDPEAQERIFSLQKKKQRVMQEFKTALALLDGPLEEIEQPKGATKVVMRNGRYIASPDYGEEQEITLGQLLTDGEWDAIGSALKWAKDRFNVLSSTFMIGGDPTQREAYGYVHFNGSNGVLALRNPFITPTHITIHLSGEYGVDLMASNLVLEKIYPYRWISPRLFAAGSTLEIPLDGYESAVFELYPLQDAKEPLVCGARFDVVPTAEDKYALSVYNAPLGIRLLNPSFVKDANVNGIKTEPFRINIPAGQISNAVKTEKIEFATIKTGAEFVQKVSFEPSVKEVRYAVLLKPDKGYEDAEFPGFTFFAGDKEIKAMVQQQKGQWSWYSMITGSETKMIRTRIVNGPKTKEWKGNATVYLICQQKEEATNLVFSTRNKVVSRPMPPKPFGEGISERILKLEEIPLTIH